VFKVPRTVFNGSELFRHMLEVPQPSGQPVDGSDEDHPLRLDGYSAADFRQLMRVVLPLSVFLLLMCVHFTNLVCIHYSGPATTEDLTTEEWKAVLALSTAWVFDSVRKVAIKQLNKARFDSVDRLVLAVKYHIDEWVVDTMNKIAQREEPLDITDADRLLPVVGVDYLLKIARVREEAPTNVTTDNSACYCSNHGRPMPSGVSCMDTGCVQRSQRDFRPVIRRVFGWEED
jgi:hypothetical protein